MKTVDLLRFLAEKGNGPLLDEETSVSAVFFSNEKGWDRVFFANHDKPAARVVFSRKETSWNHLIWNRARWSRTRDKIAEKNEQKRSVFIENRGRAVTGFKHFSFSIERMKKRLFRESRRNRPHIVSIPNRDRRAASQLWRRALSRPRTSWFLARPFFFVRCCGCCKHSTAAVSPPDRAGPPSSSCRISRLEDQPSKAKQCAPQNVSVALSRDAADWAFISFQCVCVFLLSWFLGGICLAASAGVISLAGRPAREMDFFFRKTDCHEDAGDDD